MTLHETLTEAVILDAAQRSSFGLDDPGFCISCGHEHEGIEPDARRYRCDECGERAVFGAQELALRLF